MSVLKRNGGGTADSPEEAQDLSGEFRKYIGKRVSYATHGIHKYPAKFIPQIPRYCLEAYSRVGNKILDPFMGSGTTLLESYISGRDSYGIDIHPLARLIAKVKLTPLDPDVLGSLSENLLEDIRSEGLDDSGWVPEIPNREHWFKPKVMGDLARIKRNVWGLTPGPYQDFFKVCFSSIIRKVSNSDNDSLIPEVTSFQKKLDEQGKSDYDALGRFENVVKNRLIDSKDLWKLSKDVEEKFHRTPVTAIVGRDARDIDLGDGEMDLAITSPPYASAVHYVSVHKLEMFWLDLLKETRELDSRVVGTARAYLQEYRTWEPVTSFPLLRQVLDELMSKDRKSAFVVFRYFDDMRKNLCEVNRTLKRNGRYCIVVGENTFRRTRIPTFRILADIEAGCGFELERMYVYDVINRHLDIPRWNDSRIEKDHILVLLRRRRSDCTSL